MIYYIVKKILKEDISELYKLFFVLRKEEMRD